jgi:CBS domain-containing protein
MKVRDVMTKHVDAIDSSITVAEAVKRMKEDDVSCLIVARKNADDVYGIITRRDVVNKVVGYSKNLEEVKVEEVMSKPLITISPGVEIEYAARLMDKTGLRRLVVFDGKAIVGIVSNTDILKAVTEEVT